VELDAALSSAYGRADEAAADCRRETSADRHLCAGAGTENCSLSLKVCTT